LSAAGSPWLVAHAVVGVVAAVWANTVTLKPLVPDAGGTLLCAAELAILVFAAAAKLPATLE